VCVFPVILCVCFQCVWEHEYVVWSTYWSCVDLGLILCGFTRPIYIVFSRI